MPAFNSTGRRKLNAYNPQRDLAAPSQGMTGDYTLTRNSPFKKRLVRAKVGRSGCIFRAFPTLDESGEFVPWRYGAGLAEFSDWHRRYDGINYVGDEGHEITCLLYDAGTPSQEQERNPFNVMLRALRSGDKAGKLPDSRMTRYTSSGSKKAIKPATSMYFYQGLMYVNDEKLLYNAQQGGPQGLGADEATQIIRLTKSAGSALVDRLEELAPDGVNQTDLAKRFASGDPLRLKFGRLIHVYNPVATGEVPEPKNQGFGQSFNVKLYPKLDYGRETLSPKLEAYADRVKQLVIPWDEVIYVPTTEELCEWLVRAFPSLPTMFDYVWADYPEYLNVEGVRKILRGTTSASVPASRPAAPAPVVAPPQQRLPVAKAVQQPVVSEEEEEETMASQAPSFGGMGQGVPFATDSEEEETDELSDLSMSQSLATEGEEEEEAAVQDSADGEDEEETLVPPPPPAKTASRPRATSLQPSAQERALLSAEQPKAAKSVASKKSAKKA